MSCEQETHMESKREALMTGGGGAAAAGVCSQRRRLTVEGEVAKQCGDHVQHEAEADADVGNILHPPFSRPER